MLASEIALGLKGQPFPSAIGFLKVSELLVSVSSPNAENFNPLLSGQPRSFVLLSCVYYQCQWPIVFVPIAFFNAIDPDIAIGIDCKCSSFWQCCAILPRVVLRQVTSVRAILSPWKGIIPNACFLLRMYF